MQDMKSNRTSITINPRVKEKLDNIGRINQSYCQLVEQLVDYYITGEADKK